MQQSVFLIFLHIILISISREQTTAKNAPINEHEIESNWDQVVDSFDDMNLKPELLRGIYAYGSGFLFFFFIPY